MHTFKMLLVVAAVFVSTTISNNAYALGEIRFCNTGSKPFWVARVTRDSQWFVYLWRSEGWFEVKPSKCHPTPYEPRDLLQYYFSFLAADRNGETDIYTITPDRTILGYYFLYPSSKEFCVHPTDAFNLFSSGTQGEVSNCRAGYVKVLFSLVADATISVTQTLNFSLDQTAAPQSGNSLGKKKRSPQDKKTKHYNTQSGTLSGKWSSHLGQVTIEQRGSELSGALGVPMMKLAVVTNGPFNRTFVYQAKGTVEGKQVTFSWFLLTILDRNGKPLKIDDLQETLKKTMEGHGSLVLSNDGNTLSGYYTKGTSKEENPLNLTRK